MLRFGKRLQLFYLYIHLVLGKAYKDFTSMKDNNMNIEIFLKYRNNKLTPPLQYAMMGFNLCHIVGFQFVKMGKMWVNSVIRYP